jgi:type I restriction enzyme S subunit
MREMKDSGVEWIGEIPSNWGILPLARILAEHSRKNLGNVEQNVLSLSYGNIIRRDVTDNMGLIPESFETYNIIEPGHIVLRLTDLQNDQRSLRTGLVKERGIITSAYLTLVSKLELDSRYFHFLLHTYDVMKIIYNMGNGVRQNLKFSELAKLPLPIPAIKDQHRIADYLDAKCAQIDRAIARQQEVIEKLKEYKLSVITEAVTKGLNPDVPMKDSGIEWIGEIPEGWDLKKLQAHTTMLTPMRDRPEDLDGDIPWIRIEDYCGKYINESKEQLGVSLETIKAMNLKVYPVGTILCTSSCDLGKCAIVGRELVSNQRFIGIIPDENTSSDFLYYLMLSNATRLNHLSTGTIQANLSRVAFEHLMVQFPCLGEQHEIADYLDRRCLVIDNSIDQTDAIVNKLTEYKKSLIYEVVTGKREV